MVASLIGTLVPSAPAQAAFAEGGTGLHGNSINWIEWGDPGEIISEGWTRESVTVVDADHEMVTTCTLTDLSQAAIEAYRPGSWTGDLFDDLYNIGGTGTNNQLVAGLSNANDGQTVSFDFSCSAELVDLNDPTNGLPVPLAGLVVADAESSGAGNGEYLQATPDQPATWRIIDRARSAECTTETQAILSADGTMRLAPNGDECSGGPMAIGFMQGATSAQIEMHGGGKSAIALGVMLHTDFGDAPESYGGAGSLFSPTWIGGEIDTVGTTLVSNDGFTLAQPSEQATPRLGGSIDAEHEQLFSLDASADDADGDFVDEDAIEPLGTVSVTPGQTWTLPGIECTGPGFVSGWVDWNNNGTFDEGEASDVVECTGGSVDLTWTVPLDATSTATGALSFLRLRIAADAASAATPIGLATSGEVEDHAMSVEVPALDIIKTSNATVDSRPGDTITYTVTATNNTAAAFTAAHPAVVLDDLAGVLDDATFNDDLAASEPGELGAATPLLSWTGELGGGASVDLTYSVTLAGGGDGVVRNVVWSPEDPANPVTPECNPPSGGADPTTGEPCAEVEFLLPKLTIDKVANRTDLPAIGEVTEFTITITNPGPGDYTNSAPATFVDDLSDVLDDATVVAGSLSATAGTPTIVNSELSWTGLLAAGESATVTYEVTYNGGGDQILANQVCVPASEVAPGADPCDEVQVPAALPTMWKEVSASDTPAVAGTVLTYTLHFANIDGRANAAVDAIDDLTHVLDDATVTTEPSSSDGLTVTRDGTQISITGEVPAGEADHTVTYQVTINADGERGDDIAANFLMDNDPANPPTPPATPDCEPTDDEFPDCTVTPIAAVTYAKSVTASTDPVEEGTVLTYTVTATNTGAATVAIARDDVLTDVLDDADLTSAPVSDTASVTVSDVVDGRLAIGGELAAGGTATITYEVTVRAQTDRGNNSVDNFLVPSGEEPPAECVAGSTDCTVTPLPEIATSKSVDPASGTSVLAGQEVTYTLAFTNDGAAAGTVDNTDLLAGVLDDAEVTTAPSASDAALTPTLDGDELLVTGTLAAGQTVTVFYTVTVLPDGERGDNVLGNFLVETGETPPAECLTDDPNCTTNPIPLLDAWKSVSADSDPVVAGSVLTYTLFFENTGAAAATVDMVDDLTHVTDDGDVTVEPSSDDLTVARDGDRIAITGAVPAGETYTVTYDVTLRADADRGDDIAANFLLVNDPANPPVPPTEPVCQPTDSERPDCTVTPIGRLLTSKAVSTDSDPVVAGSVLTYILTFDNQGEGPVAVDHTDVLADVLDDATLAGDPVVSDAALSLSQSADSLGITGELAAGQSVTVTYQVTVNDEADRGNNTADNFLVPTGTTPPAECLGEDPNCTVTPLPNVSTAKSVDPASGTTVVAGQEVTYALTFTNSGQAAGAVDHTDLLAGVLDDAEITTAPVASEAVLSPVLSGDEIGITGTLAVGQTVTVFYTVTVLPDGERGDNVLGNFLVETGETPPAECLADDPNCTTNPVPEIGWGKAVAASADPVVSGTVLTYTISVSNTGAATGAVAVEDVLSGVLDDATITTSPGSDTASVTVSAVADGRFLIGGELAAGQTATITYRVSVNNEADRGDNSADNFLVPPGEEPPAECAEGSPDCTVTPLPNVATAKSVDPASGSTVLAGQEVNYALTFTNSGQAAGPVDHTDLLTDVLDDARVTTAPVASDVALSAVLSGNEIGITGTLAAGQTVTVFYTVTVLPDGERGDNVLGNFLVEAGETPPAECVTDDPNCTTNPVPLLDTWKSVVADVTPVAAGTVLTYTLFFENSGAAAATVDMIDDLTHVTDDADVTVEPSSDDLTVARDGDRIAITGAVPAGETYTVTYQATVLADADRGDDIAANFLLVNDPENPPVTPTDPVCQPTDTDRPDCTVTPIGRLLVGKTVSADSDPVIAGSVLTYTLTFDNQGEGPVVIDHTDILTDVLDDAALTSAPAASDEAIGIELTEASFVVTGELAAGEVVTVTYQVTVNGEADRGNNTADNFLVPTGTTPPAECLGEDPNCTVTPLPNVSTAKSVDPASGTTVVAGQEVTYTLTFTNSGQAAGPVDHTDLLEGVLDDADITTAPTVSDEALEVSVDDTELDINGTLAAGQSVTVTYAVTVLPDGQRGDNALGNFLVESGGTPPVECLAENPNCTTNPVPLLEASKTVDPATGSEVGEGQVLTYTLTFSGTGQAASSVDHVDHLAGVLDDATWLGNVTASDGLTVTGPDADNLQITGTVAAGETATVTYQVRVKAHADQGDNVLANFLLPSSEVLGGSCDEGDTMCTKNPITPPAGPTPPPVRPGPPSSGN